MYLLVYPVNLSVSVQCMYLLVYPVNLSVCVQCTYPCKTKHEGTSLIASNNLLQYLCQVSMLQCYVHNIAANSQIPRCVGRAIPLNEDSPNATQSAHHHYLSCILQRCLSYSCYNVQVLFLNVSSPGAPQNALPHQHPGQQQGQQQEQDPHHTHPSPPSLHLPFSSAQQSQPQEQLQGQAAHPHPAPPHATTTVWAAADGSLPSPGDNEGRLVDVSVVMTQPASHFPPSAPAHIQSPTFATSSAQAITVTPSIHAAPQAHTQPPPSQQQQRSVVAVEVCAQQPKPPQQHAANPAAAAGPSLVAATTAATSAPLSLPVVKAPPEESIAARPLAVLDEAVPSAQAVVVKQLPVPATAAPAAAAAAPFHGGRHAKDSANSKLQSLADSSASSSNSDLQGLAHLHLVASTLATCFAGVMKEEGRWGLEGRQGGMRNRSGEQRKRSRERNKGGASVSVKLSMVFKLE